MKIKDFMYTWQLPIALAVVSSVYIVDHRLLADRGITNLFGPVREEVYQTIATIFGALFGFVITAFSIVIGLGNTELIERLKETRLYSRLTGAFINTIYIVGVSTITPVLAIFWDTKGALPSRGWEYLILLTSTAGSLAVLGIVFVLETLVTNGQS